MTDKATESHRTDRFDLRAIFETSQLLSASLDLEFVLSNLLRTAMGKLLVTKGAVLLFNPLHASYRVASVMGIPHLSKDEEVHLGDQDQSQIMQDDAVPETLRKAGIRLVFPVVSGHRNIGMLGLGAKFTSEAFSRRELEFMASLVNMSAAAVHNSLMVEDLKAANRDLDAKVQQLNTLFDLSQEFNATVDRTSLVKLLAFALMGQLTVTKHLFLVRGISRDSVGKATLQVVSHKGVRTDLLTPSLLETLSSVTSLHLLDGADIPAGFEALAEAGIFLILPVRHQGETGAIMCLGRKMTGKPYEPDEVEFLYALGNLAFVSLRNAYLVDEQIEKERLEEEIRLARTIQEGLQPAILPPFEGLEAASLALPSRQVAGDYYDAILLDEHRILFAIADVTGKGIPASLLMSNLQATLRILVSIDVSLEEGTAHMNRVITENTGFDKFITYFHGIYDRRDRSFTYVNAGHNPVMLVRHDGTLELLETGGLLLGVIPGATYEKGRVILGQGDILAFFTDGITEAMSPQGEEWGEERLEPLLIEARHASAQDILDRVRSAVADFTEHAPVLSDDVTMLVVKAT